jgi:thiol-disulfide isomerase/thioredoxin
MNHQTIFSPKSGRSAPAVALLAALSALPAVSSGIEKDASAPACALKKIADGTPLDLARFRGQVVYLDFWASWCGPCAESFPFLNELHSELQTQGLAVVAVNLDENRGDADGFLGKIPARFLVAADSTGQCPERFGVETMPMSYLIDRTGKVRHVQTGFRASERAGIRDKVLALLAEKS